MCLETVLVLKEGSHCLGLGWKYLSHTAKWCHCHYAVQDCVGGYLLEQSQMGESDLQHVHQAGG